MKGCSTAFVLVGVLISVGAISAGMSSGATGWIIAIIVMLLYWVGVPKLLEKYDDEYNSPDEQQNYQRNYYEKHPTEIHCPKCYADIRDLIGSKYDKNTGIGMDAYKCRQCGEIYEFPKTYVNHNPTDSFAQGIYDESKKVALIDCPACGHKVSNQAPACPNCGQPIKPPEVPRPAATSTSKFCCPKCHATDYRKIDSLERAASAQLWGVGSGKIGKQYKCNKCGHMW